MKMVLILIMKSRCWRKSISYFTFMGDWGSALEELLRCITMKVTRLPCYHPGAISLEYNLRVRKVLCMLPSTAAGVRRFLQATTLNDLFCSQMAKQRECFSKHVRLCAYTIVDRASPAWELGVWHTFQARNQKQTQMAKATQCHLQLWEADLSRNVCPNHHS